MILRDLPERERDYWLAQYREALEAARDPAGYPRLQMILRVGHLMTIACNRPGYYEAMEAARNGTESGIPAEDVFPDWDERLEAARAART